MTIEWLGLDVADSDRTVLSENLPPNYAYRVHYFKLDKKVVHDAESQFSAKVSVRLGNCSEDGAKSFLEDFYFFTSTTFNNRKGDHRPSSAENEEGTSKKPRVIFSGQRKCHHRVRKQLSKRTNEMSNDQVRDKNSDCKAKLRFSLRNHDHKDSCQEYSLDFDLDNYHNHPVCASDSLKFHPVSKNTKAKYAELFMQDLTAMEAYNRFQTKLEEEYGDQVSWYAGDRSLNPDKVWVWREHAKFTLMRFGRINSPDTYKKAFARVDKYNEKYDQELSKMVQLEDGNYIIVTTNLMMLRVHKYVPAAGDICEVDSSSNMDRIGSHVFNFVCPSPAGALPLAQVITSSETEIVLTQAFQLLQSILPDYAWNQRGRLGPRLFMSDDCEAQMKSLKNVWGSAEVLLCQFHILQVNIILVLVVEAMTEMRRHLY